MANRRFHFKPLDEGDLALLCEWLNRPHVADVFGGPQSEAEVGAKYSPRISSGSTRCYLACLDDVPVGFIQSYVPAEEHGDWWPDERDPGLVGIDQFLADGDGLGKGLGTKMVGDFVAFLFRSRAVTKVQTDPAPGNTRAIRCYERAGFHRIGVVETPDGPALLMNVRRPGAA